MPKHHLHPPTDPRARTMGCMTSRSAASTDTEVVLLGNTDIMCGKLNTPKEKPSWIEQADYDKLVATCAPLGKGVWLGNGSWAWGSPWFGPPPVGEEVAAKLKTELPKLDVEVKPNWFRMNQYRHYEFIVTVKKPTK